MKQGKTNASGVKARQSGFKFRPPEDKVLLTYRGITMRMSDWVEFIKSNYGGNDIGAVLNHLLFEVRMSVNEAIDLTLNTYRDRAKRIRQEHFEKAAELLKSGQVRIGGVGDAPDAKNAVKCGMDFGKGGETVLVRIEPSLKVVSVQSAQTADGEDFEPKPVHPDPDVFEEKGRKFRQLRLPTMEGKKPKMFAAPPKKGETEMEYLRRVYRVSKSGFVTRRCDGFEFKKTVWHGGERVKLPMPAMDGSKKSRKAVYKTYHVHRLVAMIYIPNYEPWSKVLHIDGNRMNNWLGNLKVVNNGLENFIANADKTPEME